MDLDLLVELEPPSREGAQNVSHGRRRVGNVAARGEGGAGGYELEVGQRLQLGAQLVRRRHDRRLQGDDGRGVGFDGRVTSDLDQADRLDDPVGELRCRCRLPRQDLSGGVLGVNRVALAGVAALALAGRAVHLDHPQRVAAQIAGEAAPVGAGALDAERDDRSESSGPGDELVVAGGVGGEREFAQGPPRPSMATATCSFLWVSTPTTTSPRPSAMLDIGCWSPQVVNGQSAGRAGGQDCEGTCAIRLL